MKHRILNKPAIVHKIAALAAQGLPNVEIAEKTGCNHQTVRRAKTKFKELIDRETERLIECLPDITQRTLRDMKTYDKLSKIMAEELEAGDIPSAFKNEDGSLNNTLISKFMDSMSKRETKIMESIGIFPSHNENTYITTLIQNNKYETVNPSVLKAIGHHIQDITSDPDTLSQEPVIPEVIPPEADPEEEEAPSTDFPSPDLQPDDLTAT